MKRALLLSALNLLTCTLLSLSAINSFADTLPLLLQDNQQCEPVLLNGDYPTTIKNCAKLAKNGDSSAQVALADLYK